MIRRVGIFSVFILLGFSSALAGVTGILEGLPVQDVIGGGLGTDLPKVNLPHPAALRWVIILHGEAR